ncbi:MAG: siderophore-interacting protein [Rhodococcus sp. (in: high G+C Gram-positive bacteria)]|uniref:siderophore-interacting protein n=1 Tax=Rhodococcus sp. TaxID=1831 RepID=UPI003BB6E9C5
MVKRTKYLKPEDRRILSADVLASKRISPNFVRVTIGGNDLADYTPMGFDQWFRLFMPGRHGLRLPTAASNLWYAQYLMMGKEHRPLVRNYTVREHRSAGAGTFGETAELDIDFAMHGDHTPACAWASNCEPGTTVGLLDEGITYQPPEHTTWSLLAGDESALPAIAGILKSAPRDLQGAVYVEIADAADTQDLGGPDGVPVNWLIRTDPATEVGALVVDAVRNAELPSESLYGWIAGEQTLASGLRRHLVNDRGIAKSDVTFTGYWRIGKAQG